MRAFDQGQLGAGEQSLQPAGRELPGGVEPDRVADRQHQFGVIGQADPDLVVGAVLVHDLDQESVLVLDEATELHPIMINPQVGVVARCTGHELGERPGLAVFVGRFRRLLLVDPGGGRGRENGSLQACTQAMVGPIPQEEKPELICLPSSVSE